MKHLSSSVRASSLNAHTLSLFGEHEQPSFSAVAETSTPAHTWPVPYPAKKLTCNVHDPSDPALFETQLLLSFLG